MGWLCWNESVFLEIHHAANMKINDKGSRMKIVKNIRNAEHKRCFDRKNWKKLKFKFHKCKIAKYALWINLKHQSWYVLFCVVDLIACR